MAVALSSVDVSPPHVSYSQYSDFLKCGKAYQLKRVLGLPEAPAWWSFGGKGVHSAAERHDLELEGIPQ